MDINKMLGIKPIWETPITVKSIEELAFIQMRAITMASLKRGAI
jgi:hypothetical protein